MVIKRDGSRQPYDGSKIYKAIYNCVLANGDDESEVQDLAMRAAVEVAGKYNISVEEIQDTVIRILREYGSDSLADRYANYRTAHAMERAKGEYKDDPFSTELQRFQFFDKYSRWNEQARRRETWGETVERTVSYLKELSENKLSDETYRDIHDGIYNLEVMPSMRLLAMAGKAARANQLSIYNCSYTPVDDLDAFPEVLFLSMSGCGVGYSVECQYVNRLPSIEPRNDNASGHVIIHDSTEGWVEALRRGLRLWFSGNDATFDYSKIRARGEVLKTKGGRASGPEPLRNLLDFARDKVQAAAGRQLTPLECHDIMTMIGSVVVQGGVRRTAMISLFDIDDAEMVHCKDAENIAGNEHRWFANNSAVWDARMSYDQVLAQVEKIADTGTGEPGIFSRRAANWTKPPRRNAADFGINPCGEIALRPQELCNLSIAVAREDDTLQTLMHKVRIASIIGTIQSVATDFKGLRDVWRKNSEEERLLGVDIIGQRDCAIVQREEVLRRLLDTARLTNMECARTLGIARSAAVTCVKPGGNSSVLLDASPGIHSRHAPYYIRRVRVAATSPLYHVLRHSGVSLTPENGQNEENATTWVIEFPVKSPEGTVTKKELTALDQLEYWRRVKRFYTEHNPSATITFQQHEVTDIAKFLYFHQEIIGGLSFLPADENDIEYAQLPYEEISREEYEERAANMPKIDYSWLPIYELKDATTVAQEMACVSGLCEV